MRLIKTVMAAAAAISIGFAATASAQSGAPVSNPTGLVPTLTLETVQPVLNEVGFSTNIATLSNGGRLMEVRYGNRLILLESQACASSSSCAGLAMYAILTGSTSLSQVNAFNQVSKPARATISDGVLMLDRYLIGDYGVTRGSFIVDIAVFVSMIDQWYAFSGSMATSVDYEPLIADDTAKIANEMSPAQAETHQGEIDPAVLDYLRQRAAEMDAR